MAIVLISSTGKALGPPGGTTDPFDTTGATFIVIAVGGSTLGGPGVSDNKGNTYTGLTLRDNAFATFSRLFYKLSPIVGSGHTITTTATHSAAVVFAFSGVDAYDGQEPATNGSASPLAAGNVTPTANGALIFTALDGNDVTATHITPSGFTGKVTVPGGAGFNMHVSGAYLIQTTAATINPTWTWTGTHPAAIASAAVFTPTITLTASSEKTQLSVGLG